MGCFKIFYYKYIIPNIIQYIGIDVGIYVQTWRSNISKQMRIHHIRHNLQIWHWLHIHDIYLFKYFYIQKNIVKIDK